MRIYIIIAVVFAAGSLVLIQHNVSMIITVVTIGLGLPLIYLFLSVSYYVLCVFPGVLLGSITGNQLFGTISVLLCLLIAGIAPGFRDLMDARNLEESLIRAKIVKPYRVPPRTIEMIKEPYAIYGKSRKYHPNTKSICPDICQYLIESGQVDWIRITDNENYKGNIKSLLRTGLSQLECQRNGVNRSSLPCVVASVDTGDTAAISISSERGKGVNKSIFHDLSDSRFSNWFGIKAIDNRTGKRVYSNTQQIFNTIALPYAVVPSFGYGFESKGLESLYRPKKLNALNYRSVFTDLGYSLPETTEQPDQTDWKSIILDILKIISP